MNKFLLIVFLCVFNLIFSQDQERDVIRGRIISDSLAVENITVLNLSTNVGAVSDFDGEFSIKARANDTLVFQGLAYVSQKYIITESDLLIDEFKIKLAVKITELDEVIVTPNSLTGILETDTKKIKVYGLDMSKIDVSKLKPDEIRNAKPVHPNANSNLSSLRGIDFIAIFKMFTSKKKKEERRLKRLEQHENEKWSKEVLAKSFYQHLMQRYSHSFFVSNLKIKSEDIIAFVSFAEPDYAELSRLLKKENELILVEYLIQKSKEFKRNKSLENHTNSNYEEEK